MTTRIWIDWGDCTTPFMRVYDADTGKEVPGIKKLVLTVDGTTASRVLAVASLTDGTTECYEVWPPPAPTVRIKNVRVKNVDDMSDDEVRKLVKKVMDDCDADMKCPTCGGKGWVADFQSRIPCPDCTP